MHGSTLHHYAGDDGTDLIEVHIKHHKTGKKTRKALRYRLPPSDVSTLLIKEYLLWGHEELCNERCKDGAKSPFLFMDMQGNQLTSNDCNKLWKGTVFDGNGGISFGPQVGCP